MTTAAPTHQTAVAPRHVKVTGRLPMFGYERCEDPGCVVDSGGIATSCGRPACPSCGSGGTNLTRGLLPDEETGAWVDHMQCTCGRSWVAAAGS